MYFKREHEFCKLLNIGRRIAIPSVAIALAIILFSSLGIGMYSLSTKNSYPSPPWSRLYSIADNILPETLSQLAFAQPADNPDWYPAESGEVPCREGEDCFNNCPDRPFLLDDGTIVMYSARWGDTCNWCAGYGNSCGYAYCNEGYILTQGPACVKKETTPDCEQALKELREKRQNLLQAYREAIAAGDDMGGFFDEASKNANDAFEEFLFGRVQDLMPPDVHIPVVYLTEEDRAVMIKEIIIDYIDLMNRYPRAVAAITLADILVDMLSTHAKITVTIQEMNQILGELEKNYNVRHELLQRAIEIEEQIRILERECTQTNTPPTPEPDEPDEDQPSSSGEGASSSDDDIPSFGAQLEIERQSLNDMSQDIDTMEDELAIAAENLRSAQRIAGMNSSEYLSPEEFGMAMNDITLSMQHFAVAVTALSEIHIQLRELGYSSDQSSSGTALLLSDDYMTPYAQSYSQVNFEPDGRQPCCDAVKGDGTTGQVLVTQHRLYNPTDDVKIVGNLAGDILSELQNQAGFDPRSNSDVCCIVQLMDIDGNIVVENKFDKLFENGDYATSIALPENVSTGVYKIQTKLVLPSDVIAALDNSTMEQIESGAVQEIAVADSRSLMIRVGETEYGIDIATSSNVNSLRFNQAEKKMTLILEGEEGIMGVSKIAIPKTLMNGEVMVLIDGEKAPDSDVVLLSNTDNLILMEINYYHSRVTIDIVATNVVPEFPLSVLAMAAIGFTILISALMRFVRLTKYL